MKIDTSYFDLYYGNFIKDENVHFTIQLRKDRRRIRIIRSDKVLPSVWDMALKPFMASATAGYSSLPLVMFPCRFGTNYKEVTFETLDDYPLFCAVSTLKQNSYVCFEKELLCEILALIQSKI